jgi:hypoxia up-regulated 1
MRKANLLVVLALLGSILAGQADANVIGFDFGSNFFKVVLVKPANPFQIVENITSKRKTESYMSIGPEDRKFGVDSYNFATKAPKTTFTQSAFFLGLDFDTSRVNNLLDNFVMNEFVEDERGLIAFQTFSIKNEDDAEKGSAKTIYYTEEMVAQILAYGKFLAERQAGGAVVDTVLTVPSYFTQE